MAPLEQSSAKRTRPKRRDVRGPREKKYPCPDCGRMFDRPGAVTQHRRSHTGERPYACPGCSKGLFSTVSNYHRHMRRCCPEIAQHPRLNSLKKGDQPHKDAEDEMLTDPEYGYEDYTSEGEGSREARHEEAAYDPTPGLGRLTPLNIHDPSRVRRSYLESSAAHASVSPFPSAPHAQHQQQQQPREPIFSTPSLWNVDQTYEPYPHDGTSSASPSAFDGGSNYSSSCSSPRPHPPSRTYVFAEPCPPAGPFDYSLVVPNDPNRSCSRSLSPSIPAYESECGSHPPSNFLPSLAVSTNRELIYDQQVYNELYSRPALPYAYTSSSSASSPGLRELATIQRPQPQRQLHCTITAPSFLAYHDSSTLADAPIIASSVRRHANIDIGVEPSNLKESNHSGREYECGTEEADVSGDSRSMKKGMTHITLPTLLRPSAPPSIHDDENYNLAPFTSSGFGHR